MFGNVGTIGRSVVIKGELSAAENLIIEGQVEGTIDLGRHVLTIGPNARTAAQVSARVVNVMGRVDGDIVAVEAINIHETATVNGALEAPRVGIEQGASFRGQIDIRVSIPLESVIKRLKPERAHVRFLRQLLRSSISVIRPKVDRCRPIGVSPKLAEATMRLQGGDTSRRGRASARG